MAQGSNQMLVRNDLGVRSSRLSSILENSQIPSSISCAIIDRLSNNRSIPSTNRLPNEESSVRNNRLPNIHSSLSANRLRGEEFGVKYNRLPCSDSGVSCKNKYYSSSSAEESSNSADDKEKENSRRNDETRRKSVSFSTGSTINLTDEHVCVTDIETDSVLETDSDLTLVNTESTSTGQGNGDSCSQKNCYTLKLSNGSTSGISVRNNNTILKRHRSAYSESDGNSIMLFNCNCFASQVSEISTIPTRSTSYNIDVSTDQRSVLQHQQLPGPPCSTTDECKHNLPQYLPCHSLPSFEAIAFRSHPSIHHEVDRNFDPQSSAPLLDDRRHTELYNLCGTSQASRAAQCETQTLTTIARCSVCDTTNNKTVDEESAVSVPRSCYTTFIIILMVFNIIFIAGIGFMTLMLLNDHTYHECPLCDDIMNQVKRHKGGNISYGPIQDYLKENGKDGRCCLDHALIFKLMAQTNSVPPEPNQNMTKLADTVINIIGNAKEKAAIHLQSIPFNSELSSQMIDLIRWNFKDKTQVGNSWDIADNDTKIKIPLTGVYYIYAMVQYLFISANSTRRRENTPTFEEFPLSVSLYKTSHSETERRRIGTVTLHCTFASQSIEHNSIIQKIEQMTKDDKVFLEVSNKQFLNNKQNIHQIGIFKVN